jgi:hypothetical protein
MAVQEEAERMAAHEQNEKLYDKVIAPPLHSHVGG